MVLGFHIFSLSFINFAIGPTSDLKDTEVEPVRLARFRQFENMFGSPKTVFRRGN